MTDKQTEPIPTSFEEVDTRFVAFCDILGFSNKILTDFENTLEVYRDFGKSISQLPVEDVQVTMYSDSILITSHSLSRILNAVQALWFVALTRNFMIRGAITRGRYWQYREGDHLLVASDALIEAVKMEKSVIFPAVVLSDEIEIEDDYWMSRFVLGATQTPLLHFRDRNIVNPFNRYWFNSAHMRASQLMEESPAHRDKYLWFLALYNAVQNDHELVPPAVLSNLIAKGVLKKA